MTATSDIRAKLNFGTWILCLLLLPAIAHAGGLGMAPLTAIVAGMGYLTYRSGLNLKSIPAWFWLVIIFILWAMVTSFWSPYEDRQTLTNPVKTLIGFVLYCGAFLSLSKVSQGGRRKLLWGLGLVLLVLLLMMSIDLSTNLALTNLFDPPKPDEFIPGKTIQTYMNLGHSLALMTLIFAVCGWPIWQSGRWGKFISSGLAIWIMLLAGLGGFIIGLLIMIFIICVAGIARKRPRKILILITSLGIGLIVFAPLSHFVLAALPTEMVQGLPTSWEHRVVMWHYVSGKIPEAILFGHGFDASRVIDATYINNAQYEADVVSLHPHNFGLQIWYETGLVGAILSALAILAIGRAALKLVDNDPNKGPSVCALMLAVICLASVSYGVWQEWFWASLIFFSALAVKLPALIERSSN